VDGKITLDEFEEYLVTGAETNGYAKVFDARWGENAMPEGCRLYFCC